MGLPLAMLASALPATGFHFRECSHYPIRTRAVVGLQKTSAKGVAVQWRAGLPVMLEGNIENRLTVPVPDSTFREMLH